MCCGSDVFLVFFFFQAEDGIRDRTVTGVQTCALPISIAWRGRRPCWASSSPGTPSPSTAPRWSFSVPGRPRSEERRVGKECRSRWSAYHEKKKEKKHKKNRSP